MQLTPEAKQIKEYWIRPAQKNSRTDVPFYCQESCKCYWGRNNVDGRFKGLTEDLTRVSTGVRESCRIDCKAFSVEYVTSGMEIICTQTPLPLGYYMAKSFYLSFFQ